MKNKRLAWDWRNALVAGGAKNLWGLISRTLAAEGAKVAVHYHKVLKKLIVDTTDEAVAWLKSQGIGGRITEIQDIAPIVKFLVTEGGWITGQSIFANGGFTTR